MILLLVPIQNTVSVFGAFTDVLSSRDELRSVTSDSTIKSLGRLWAKRDGTNNSKHVKKRNGIISFIVDSMSRCGDDRGQREIIEKKTPETDGKISLAEKKNIEYLDQREGKAATMVIEPRNSTGMMERSKSQCPLRSISTYS